MGTATLVFSYEVAEGDKAPGGISIEANKLTLNGGTITKSGDSTVDAVLTHSAVGIDSSHKVDGVRPTLVGAVTSTDGTKVILTFSEDLNAAVPTNTPFTVKVGNVSVSLGGTPAVSNLEVTLTLAAAVTTDQAVTVSYADPTSGNDATAVQDTAGNDAESFSYWAVTNAATPRVTSVSITSNPGSDDTYGIDDSIEATVTFSGKVGVTGTLQLELNFNGSPKQARYESGMGTATLVFSYEVAEGDEAPGGISIGVSKLTRNGGTITKSGDSTVDAVLTHSAVGIDSSHKVDGVRPTLVGAVTSTDGTKVILTFSEDLNAAVPTNTPLHRQGRQRVGLAWRSSRCFEPRGDAHTDRGSDYGPGRDGKLRRSDLGQRRNRRPGHRGQRRRELLLLGSDKRRDSEGNLGVHHLRPWK